MKTQNLAVMFTDIAGFTARTSAQTREENARMMRRHDALLVPVIRAFAGRRVKSVGDALLVVFGSPTDSVLCGMAIQDRLWDYNRRAPPEDRLAIRVAVNLGEVRVARSVSGTDVFGEPVNIAARVEGEAEAGEVWFTEAVYLVMNKAEVPAEDLGYRDLAGLPEPIRLYRVARGRYTLQATPVPGAEPLPQPPYGNVGLSRVRGLAPPEPAALDRPPAAVAGLARMADGIARAGEIAGGIGRLPRALPPRLRWLALPAAVALAAALVFAVGGSREERLIEGGHLEEARAAIEARARDEGEGSAQVLYLRARLREERARRAGDRPGEALDLYGRAGAAGSARAFGALERLASSEDCATRRGAARALAATGSREALPALRSLAGGEPAAPEPADPIEGVKRLFGADGRCGAGDIARDAIRELGESP